MDIAVIGAGRVGTALAVLLREAGHDIVAASGRETTAERVARHLPGVPVVPLDQAARLGQLVLIAVPDGALAAVVDRCASSFREGQWVAHTSGAHGLDILASASVSGARRLAVHPLQTFPSVKAALDTVRGCAMAVTADDEEGYSLGEALARDVKARPFRLPDERRSLYHAGAVFASNYLVTVSGIAEHLFAMAGVPDPVEAMRPLQEASLANVGTMGPRAALTGPAVRGDAGTVNRNLAAVSRDAPDAVAAYIALCRAALDLAGERLDAAGRAAVEEVRDRWT